MSAADRTPYSLDRPLPVEVVAGKDAWLGYRRYPVFSARWLLGRTLVFALVIGSIAGLIGMAMMATSSPRNGAMSALHFFAAFMVMVCAGPGLATLVRHRGWPLRRERGAVIAAVVVGVALSFIADAWASEFLERAGSQMKQADAEARRVAVNDFWRGWLTAMNVTLALAIYAALGGGLALRAYFRELTDWREARNLREMAALKADKQRADLQLGVLQAQVEPHFLFNTLASVRALVRQDADRAERTLDALVDYLRATIPKLRDEEARLASTLGQQLDLCASYLELMHIRTDGRLRHAIVADAALRALPFPPMLLITLVENAIKHGVEPKPGPGLVTIEATREGEGLRVSVIDDGLGLDIGVGGGLGLANLRAQLETLYRGRARFSLQGEPARGVRASLWIPIDEVMP